MAEKKVFTSMPDPGTDDFNALLQELSIVAKESHRKYLRMEQEAEERAAQIVLNC